MKDELCCHCKKRFGWDCKLAIENFQFSIPKGLRRCLAGVLFLRTLGGGLTRKRRPCGRLDYGLPMTSDGTNYGKSKAFGPAGVAVVEVTSPLLRSWLRRPELVSCCTLASHRRRLPADW